jgi:hypothetical protein
VIKRFQIEDLIVQDASGVVFRALDSETGKPVAVRRFFPFGASGGGLLPDEQTAYNIAIGRLSGIKHPALRSVISGGCDPVDGIPYIATEWVDGDSIQGLVDQGTFRAETATELLTQALEVCELLSQVLAEEAVWIETDLQTIIMGNHGSGRRFTFWISPLKWLGSVGDRSTGLLSIVTLAEQIMGWQGRVVHDQAAGGLGGWLKWLRSCAVFTSLREARENLAASVGAEPPPDADKLVAKATRPLLVTTSQPKAPATKSRLILGLALAIVLVAFAGWWRSRTPSAADPRASSDSVLENTAAARASRRAAELAAEAARQDARHGATIAGQQRAADQQGGTMPWDSRELILQNDGNTITVEGVVRDIKASSSGKTLYLVFADLPDKNAALAGIATGDNPPDRISSQLEAFRGKKVRVTGQVRIQKLGGLERPDILFNEVSAITTDE